MIGTYDGPSITEKSNSLCVCIITILKYNFYPKNEYSYNPTYYIIICVGISHHKRSEEME